MNTLRHDVMKMLVCELNIFYHNDKYRTYM